MNTKMEQNELAEYVASVRKTAEQVISSANKRDRDWIERIVWRKAFERIELKIKENGL